MNRALRRAILADADQPRPQVGDVVPLPTPQGGRFYRVVLSCDARVVVVPLPTQERLELIGALAEHEAKTQAVGSLATAITEWAQARRNPWRWVRRRWW